MYVVYNDPLPQTSMKCITLLLFLQLSNEYRIEAAMKVETNMIAVFAARLILETTYVKIALLLSSVTSSRFWRNCQIDNSHYHISCCNMFVFACPIIAWSVGYLPSRQISVFAPEFNFWYLQLGLKENMSKYKER